MTNIMYILNDKELINCLHYYHELTGVKEEEKEEEEKESDYTFLFFSSPNILLFANDNNDFDARPRNNI